MSARTQVTDTQRLLRVSSAVPATPPAHHPSLQPSSSGTPAKRSCVHRRGQVLEASPARKARDRAARRKHPAWPAATPTTPRRWRETPWQAATEGNGSGDSSAHSSISIVKMCNRFRGTCCYLRCRLPNVCDCTRFGHGNGSQQVPDKMSKVGKSIGLGSQNDDCDGEGRKVLLKRQISINGHENVERSVGGRQKFSIPNGRPAHLARSLDIVPSDIARKTPVDTLVKEYLHEAAATRRSFACSRNSMTCSRLTEGKPARNSSMESPASR